MRLAVAGLVLASVATPPLYAQALKSAAATVPGAKVTVATRKGDFVDGTLRSATGSAVLIEVAGQPLTFPVADLRYVSFVGRIEGTGASATAASAPAPGSAEDAFDAIEEIHKAVRVGVLRPQYSELLVKHLPRITDFIEKPGQDWADARIAMEKAVTKFQTPMRSPAAWTSASESLTMGGQWAAYAKWLREQPGEVNHRERPFRGTMAIGQPVRGRLGEGDTNPPPGVRQYEDQAEYPADVYDLELAQDGTLSFAVDSAPGPKEPRIVLVDAAGKTIETISRPNVMWARGLKAGRYTVWVIGDPIAVYSITPTLE